MYNVPKKVRTSIKINDSVEGETIESRLERLVNNGDETIEGKELIFTRPEDGIVNAFNIRHDWWDEAAENSSIMAEKRSELDSAQLKKRKELLKKKQEEENFLKEQAAKGIKAKQEGQPGDPNQV